MKQTVTESRFIEAFQALRPNPFSKAALAALFRHLSQLEIEMRQEIELDVVSLWCQWREYSDPIEAAEAYGWEAPEIPEGEERDDTSDRKAMEFLQDIPQTTVLEFEGGVLVITV